jgi:hypothetical protein
MAQRAQTIEPESSGDRISSSSLAQPTSRVEATDLERLDAIAAALERSASWFPACGAEASSAAQSQAVENESVTPTPPPASSVRSKLPRSREAPGESESERISPPPATKSTSSSPRTARLGAPALAKKERRELERKQRILAAQRAADARRERRRQREQRRRQRLAKRKLSASARSSSPRNKPAPVAVEPVPIRRPPLRVPWWSFLPLLLVSVGLVLAALRGASASLEQALLLLLLSLALGWVLRKLV